MSTSVRPVGEHAVIVELDDNVQAVRLAHRVRAALGARAQEVVVGHRTVLVGWTPGTERPALDLGALAVVPDDPADAAEPRVHRLDVRYDGEDLDDVARCCSMSVEEVVRRHTQCALRVAFLGFSPGFAYLLGGDPALALPRREHPRAAVPAGSVALAGPYSAIYPSASPGGWHLLGRCDAVLFNPAGDPPALLSAGDEVRLRAIES